MPGQRTTTVFLALCCMALPFAATAQTAEDALRLARRGPAFSARMAGMAGAGIAGIPDAGALLYNPAGLGFASSEISGGIGTLNGVDEAFYGENPDEREVYDTGLQNAAYLYRAPTRRGSLVLGASIARLQTYDRQREYHAMNPVLPAGANYYPAYVDPSVAVRQSGDITQDGELQAFSVGGAVELLRGVMAGAALHVPFGSYRALDRLEEVYTGAIAQELTSYTSTEALESEFAGVSLQAGLSTEIAFGLQFGLTLESPTYYSVSEDFETSYDARFADGVVDAEETTGAFDYAVVTPWRFGTGLGYQLGALTLAADAIFVDWTQLAFHGDTDTAYLQEQNAIIREELEPVVQTRVGASLALSDLELRAGFAQMPDPFESGFIAPGGEQTDAARSYVSAGLSYRFAERLWLDASWLQQRFNDIYTLYAAEDVVREDVTRTRYLVGLRYSF